MCLCVHVCENLCVTVKIHMRYEFLCDLECLCASAVCMNVANVWVWSLVSLYALVLGVCMCPLYF